MTAMTMTPTPPGGYSGPPRVHPDSSRRLRKLVAVTGASRVPFYAPSSKVASPTRIRVQSFNERTQTPPANPDVVNGGGRRGA